MTTRIIASRSYLQKPKRSLFASPSFSLVTGGVSRCGRKAEAPIGRLNINSPGAVRSLHRGSACFSSVDALDMADTFAHRHSKSQPIPHSRLNKMFFSRMIFRWVAYLMRPRCFLHYVLSSNLLDIQPHPSQWVQDRTNQLQCSKPSVSNLSMSS
jgi:hypothetical protein